MKKLFISFLISVFIVSVVFIGTSCKGVAVEETTTVAETIGVETTVQPETGVETTVAAEEVQLTLWWWGETDAPGLENYINDSITVYQDSHPNVKINQVLQATEDTVTAFKAAAEAKKGPDIATIWYGVYQLEEVWADNIEPLDNYITGEETQHWIGKDLSVYDGKLWGSDLYGYGMTVLYNKELFKNTGLDPENPPKTWDEFLSACETLKKAGISPFALGFKSPGWDTSTLSNFFWPQKIDSTKTIKDAVIGNKSFADDEFKELYVKMNELKEKGYLIEDAASILPADARMEWRKGNAAFALVANQQALIWYDELGSSKMGFMSFPSITDKPVDWIPVAPITLFITKWSPNKDVAADFLKFLHSDERMNAMADQLKGSCVPADDRFDVSQITDPQKKLVFDQIINGFKKGTWFTDAVIPYAIIGDGLLPAGQKIIIGESNPDGAAQIVEDAAKTWREQSPEAFEKYKTWAK